MQAILDDGRVTAAFGLTRPLEKMEHVGHDLYRLSSGSCSMDIVIADDAAVVHPSGWTGRRSIVLQPKPLVCK